MRRGKGGRCLSTPLIAPHLHEVICMLLLPESGDELAQGLGVIDCYTPRLHHPTTPYGRAQLLFWAVYCPAWKATLG